MRAKVDDTPVRKPIQPERDLSSQDHIFQFPNVIGGWLLLGGFAATTVLLVLLEAFRAM
jgi:hypothetical protein